MARSGVLGRKNWAAGRRLWRPVPLPARKLPSAPMPSAPSAPVPSAPRFDPLRLLTRLTPARLTPRKERPGRICRVFCKIRLDCRCLLWIRGSESTAQCGRRS